MDKAKRGRELAREIIMLQLMGRENPKSSYEIMIGIVQEAHADPVLLLHVLGGLGMYGASLAETLAQISDNGTSSLEIVAELAMVDHNEL
jgi:hypothetical protein